MPRMISVASRAHTPILIDGAPAKEGEVAPEVILWPCKPGEEPKVTENVDSDLFYGWIERNRSHPAVVNGWFDVLPLAEEPAKAPVGRPADPAPSDATKGAKA